MTPSLPIFQKTPLWLVLLAALVFAAGCATPGGGGYVLLRPDPPVLPVVKPITGPLPLDQAIARAIAHSEKLASLQATVDTAVEACKAAGDWRDPELRFQYGEETTDTSRNLESPSGSRPVSTTSEDSDSYRIGIRVFPS